MSYGCVHVDKVSIERYDLGGVLNVLAGRIERLLLADRVGRLLPGEVDEQSYYAGAYAALSTIYDCEWRDQTEFFAHFDALMEVDDGQD